MRTNPLSPVTPEDAEPAAEMLRALANPQRLAIVCTLVEGERAVSELEAGLGIRQPSLSQHLGSLREAGLIVGRREAKAVFYRIGDPRAAELVATLHAIFCAKSGSGAAKLSGSARPPAARRPDPPQPQARMWGEAAVFARVGEDA